ncbi:hypothetical protein DY000_02004207 [Brassica cretica]|uniref:Uncharacterized protein n=1 Tax=Brassica cretica TaxID=69181 RepID=A0ABQ7C975_BRACR|nr:hypothetical protein DY000_02004207 [Brassica cretica]
MIRREERGWGGEERRPKETKVTVERFIFDVKAIETPSTRQSRVGDPERRRDDESSRRARAGMSPPKEMPIDELRRGIID